MPTFNRPRVVARLWLIAFAGSLAAASGASAPARAAERAEIDWPQFLGPARNGVSDQVVVSTFSPGGPPVLWKHDVGAGFSGVAVASGKLILFHRLADREVVECLDPKSGASVWKGDYATAYSDDFGFDEGPRATPTIDGGSVFTFGAEGALSAWNLADGKQIWSLDTKKQFGSRKGYFGRACSPLVEGNAVIVNIGGLNGAGIVALDRASGRPLWSATEDEASYSSPVAATVAGKREALVFTRAGLVGLDPADGRLQFRFPWRARIAASVNAAAPIVIGDKVFLSASYGTGAVLLQFKSPTSVEKVWSSDEALSNHYATSAQSGGFLYGFHGRQEEGPAFRCVELQTGKVRWSDEGLGAGTVMIAGHQLLVLTEHGRLMLAPDTPDTFKPTASAQILSGESRAYPALAGGLLYARDKEKLVCVDLRKPPK